MSKNGKKIKIAKLIFTVSNSRTIMVHFKYELGIRNTEGVNKALH